MFVTKRNGKVEQVHFDKITSRINKLVKPEEKKYIDPILVAQKVVGSIFSGITTEELDNESAKICINLCTSHHLYSMLAGRIVVSNLHKKTINTFVEKEEMIQEKLGFLELNWLSWIKENRDELNNMIDYERDYMFDYFGFKTLERAYLTKIGDQVIERPQDMLMRVASFINQGNLVLTKKTYDMISQGLYTHASPTLFNSGNQRSQLASCFLLGTDDSLEGITKTWADVAKISKWGGGIGLHVSNIRAKDTMIKGTNGPSSGIIPMLKVYNEIARYIDQGGKRKGSIAIYLEPHHPDVLAFLELKKNFGAETERARDLFLAMWVSDVFMKQVEKDGDWYLMCPEKCPGLTDAYGEEYEKLYWSYVVAKKYNCIVKARHVMKAILDSQLETGTPYIGFKDNINNKSNQKNIGTIKSSNLCVHEDTMILTDQGYKNIKLLKDSEVNIWNGEQWSKVTVKQTGANQNLVRVNLSNGVSLDCTPEHKFYIQEGFSRGNIIETEASKLKIDSKLIKFNLPPAIEFENPTEFKYAYTHGAFCGDGTTYDNYSKTKKYPKLYLYGAKKNLLQYIDYQCYTENTNADRYDIILPKDLNPKFMIPENASINTRLRWFEGYCDTDGTIARNGTNESLQIGSTNKDFLSNIRLMLHTLGIESKVTKGMDEGLRMMPDHKGGSKEYICKQAFRLLIGSNDLYQLSLLGFSPKRLQYTPRIPQRNATQFVKVTAVEESYKNVDTYCFTEPLRHMGVFNGVLTGQCHEILEYSDASEYAVCNLASIAINKCVEPFSNDKVWTIYTKDNCKFCQWTKSYLMNNGYFFNEEYVDSDKLKSITGLEKPTYPQIYYGEQYIGGYSDFFQFTKATFDYDKLYDIAYLATVNLNKIIDINFYPVIEAKKSNIRHRPIAVGIQGLADALVQLKICFDSEESLEYNAKMMETIYLACLTASCDISKEREDNFKQLDNIFGLPEYYDPTFEPDNNIYHKLKPNMCELNHKFSGAYSTFEGSPISQGQFQFDLWSLDRSKLHYKDRWALLEESIKKYGVRNSLVTALMPTASTSQILGNNECFEFFTNNIYTRRTLAGDFPLVNKYLIDELNNIGLWTPEMKQMILANNGSIAQFSNIPEQIRNLFKTIWEIKQIWILKNAAVRGPFVDQTQSMNIFMAVPDYQKLYSSHFWAWSNGLKTGIYYLRSRAAKDAVKVTVDPSIQKKLDSLISDEHEICENCSG